MKKKGSLDRRKNTFEKKRLSTGVFARSPGFRVDPTGQSVFSQLIASLNFDRLDQCYWVLLTAGPNTTKCYWQEGLTLLGLAGQQDPLSLGLAVEPDPAGPNAARQQGQHHWVILGRRTQQRWVLLGSRTHYP